MAIYALTAYENTGPDRMWRLHVTDLPGLLRLRTFTVCADSLDEAMEQVWVIGQKFEPDGTYQTDINGVGWPLDHRSMCTGDLLRTAEGRDYVVDTVGFADLANYFADRKEAVNA